MFFETHNLPRGLFKACVTPRPIAWVSTISEEGVHNLAPFSYFNAIADDPPMVMIAFSAGPGDGKIKDTLRNIMRNGELVINVVTQELAQQMNATAAAVDPATSEFDLASVTRTKAELVKPARVQNSPVQLECQLHQVIDLPTPDPQSKAAMVLAKVLGIGVCASVMTDGRLDIQKLRPMARLGYHDYCIAQNPFSLARP